MFVASLMSIPTVPTRPTPSRGQNESAFGGGGATTSWQSRPLSQSSFSRGTSYNAQTPNPQRCTRKHDIRSAHLTEPSLEIRRREEIERLPSLTLNEKAFVGEAQQIRPCRLVHNIVLGLVLPDLVLRVGMTQRMSNNVELSFVHQSPESQAALQFETLSHLLIEILVKFVDRLLDHDELM